MNLAYLECSTFGGGSSKAEPPKIRRGLPCLWIAARSILGLAVVGCQVAAPRHEIEETVHAPEDVAVSQQQVRLRLRALIEPLSGAIVASADRIMAGTTDRSVRREALVWKLEAVPALREALFRPNPFVAAMDTWVLTLQMAGYFESGPGRAALGDAAPVAVTTCQALATEIERIAASMTKSGDVSDVREFAQKWAGEHPIQHSIASRESTLSRVTERELQETFTTVEIAANVAVTLDDLSRRMDIFSGQLLDQARWQAEVFAMDQATTLGVDRVMPLAENVARSADHAVAMMDRISLALEECLAVATHAPGSMIAELSRMTDSVQEHREVALKQLAEERVAAVRDLGGAARAERVALVADIERISQKAVNHASWRAAQVFGGLALAAWIGAVGLLFLARRLFFNCPPRVKTQEPAPGPS
ncbi:MAG TPA: hypothetical protein VF530_22445 [Planctomycetota bacterium]